MSLEEKARALAAIQRGPFDMIKKGGVWIWPILFIALISLVCGIIKLMQLASIHSPKTAWMTELIKAWRKGAEEEVHQLLSQSNHPISSMIERALEFTDSGPDVVEEVFYEQLLSLESHMQKWLPFIAITAAIAPLLGLLGTVSGMIQTFNVITVVGTSDTKPLAGGISEALVTTLFGLAVAIPALVLHSILSRKSNGIVQLTEKLGLMFVNGMKKK